MIGHVSNIFKSLKNNVRESTWRMNRRFSSRIRITTRIFDIITFISAIFFITSFIIFIGFEHNSGDMLLLVSVVRGTQIVFIANVLYNLLFNKGNTFRGAKFLSWIINFFVLLSVIPWLLRIGSGHMILTATGTRVVFYVIITILLIYSFIELSYGVMSLLSRRTNPALILSASFIIFIVVGAFMLKLPRCSYYPISFTDALFVSTSAVCITGLTPIDVATNLTPFGQLILAVLIQIGALGVMTFTSFFALFFTGNSSIFSQMLLSDIIYSKSMSSLIPMLLYILIITLFIEIIGALMIFISVHGMLGMSLSQEIFFSCFHAISAFCNAGFSTLPGGLSNPVLLYGNQSIYWVISLLIVLGALGFPILANFREVSIIYIRRLTHRIFHHRLKENPIHIYSVNTKIVLVTFFSLFFIGAVLFWLLERSNTIAGMSCTEQITQSVFNSVTPRSAGFTSVNPATFLNSTLLIVLFLMWIGGASQSTAGGIKVNTFAIIFLFLRSVIHGRRDVTAFGRTIANGSLRRGLAVVMISIISLALFSIILIIIEPELPPRALLFETVSALFTVGSSLGITDQLSDLSKIIISIAMFLGRVGMLSLLMGFAGKHHEQQARLPEGTIIIS